MRVASTLIVYDADAEHKKLAALFDSTDAAKTDFYAVAVDQKSVPGTVEWIAGRLAGRCDVIPFVMEDEDGVEDFARARNISLALVPKDCDWWYWIDSDDTLQMTAGQDFHQFLQDMAPEVNAIGFLYDYERDSFGNPTTTHRRGRLYRNTVGWEWRQAVHEDVYPVGHGTARALALKSEDFLWVHNTAGRPTSFDRNMRILKKMLMKTPDDPRTWYYIGNAYFAAHEWAKAAEAYEKYDGLSGWALERYMALIYLGMAYGMLGMTEKSLGANNRAWLLMPELADAYFGLGENYAGLGHAKKALYFGELGMKCVADGGIPDADMFINLNAYGYKPYLWMADCYLKLGKNQRALECLEAAAKQRPEKDILRGIEHIKWAMSRQRITGNGIDLAAGLLRRNEPLKAKAILENLPAGEGDDLNVRNALAMANERIQHLYDPLEYANVHFSQEDTILPETTVDKQLPWLPRMQWALRRLKAMGAKRVLELGVGNASQALLFAKNGIQVIGIDVDRRRVKEANWAAVRFGLVGTKDWKLEEEGETITVPDIGSSSPVQFHWATAEDVSQKIVDLGPYDAVVAAELLEHVPDPARLLDACEKYSPHVLLVTPDGAYDGPQEHNPVHVRAWSQRELARMIVPRGRFIEMHRVAGIDEGDQKQLVCEYVAGEKIEGPTAIIWCPPTALPWTPDSPREGGVFGSETAVIRVAEALARQGIRVTVYAQSEGVWNGVRYAQFEAFRPQPCNLFVAWRTLGAIPDMKDFAEARFIWVHDVHFGDATPEGLEGVTILALSEWHQGYLAKKYPGARIAVSGNGIEPERFNKDVKREPHRLIFAHSPDRGLDRVLALFPKIRERYPDATLEVFYGFELARGINPEYCAKVEEMAKQPGVTLHGKIDQDRLAEEYLKASALIYPSSLPSGAEFTETYCISVVEALAAGCFPITADHGALRETNMGGAHFRLATMEHEALFQLFAFWDRPLQSQSVIRKRGRKWARRQTWDKVAAGWLRLARESAQPEPEVEVAYPALEYANRV